VVRITARGSATLACTHAPSPTRPLRPPPSSHRRHCTHGPRLHDFCRLPAVAHEWLCAVRARCVCSPSPAGRHRCPTRAREGLCGAGGQIALVWMAVLAAGARTVRIGIGPDSVRAVRDVVPALLLKESGSVPRNVYAAVAVGFFGGASVVLL
jgi:hypothetical protein